MLRCHSKMHLSEANSRRQFSKNSREMRNFLNDLGFKKGGEKTGHSSLPLKKLNDYSYFPTSDHSVSRTGWPLLTMVGYTLSKPLWSDAL